jgi:hypothetical protein
MVERIRRDDKDDEVERLERREEELEAELRWVRKRLSSFSRGETNQRPTLERGAMRNGGWREHEWNQ